jgi:hypothetical protein
MVIIFTFFFILSIFVSFDLGADAGVIAGLAAFIGTQCAMFSGSGLKGSLLAGTKQQKIGGLVSATVLTTIGYFILSYSKLFPKVFGIQFTTVTWTVFAFAIGFIATQKQHTVN